MVKLGGMKLMDKWVKWVLFGEQWGHYFGVSRYSSEDTRIPFECTFLAAKMWGPLLLRVNFGGHCVAKKNTGSSAISPFSIITYFLHMRYIEVSPPQAEKI